MNQALITRTLAHVLGGPDAAHEAAWWRAVFEGVLPVVGSTPSIGIYPLISYVFTFPKHLHRFLRGEARPVPV
jgi:hypothetical protein